MSQIFAWGGQSIGVSASALVLPMNIQDWFPLGWTGWISLQSKGLSRVFSTPQFKSISSLVLSFLYSPTLTSIHDHWKNHSFDYMDLCCSPIVMPSVFHLIRNILKGHKQSAATRRGGMLLLLTQLLSVSLALFHLGSESESECCSVVSNSLWPHGLYSPWNSPGQNAGVGSLSLLQGIFPTQRSNPGLPLCREILYQLSHKGSLRIQEWIAYPLSSGSSWPRNWTGGPDYRRILNQLSYQGSRTWRTY